MSKISKFVSFNGSEFFLTAELGSNGYFAHVAAYQVIGEVLSEMGVEYDPPKKSYLKKGGHSSLETTEDLVDAERVVAGTIKWDGCSDLNLYPDDEGYVHFCGKKGAAQLGMVLEAAYEMARELIVSKVHEGCFND